MAICIICSKSESVSGYSYSTSSRSTGCVYDDFDTCMRINNPKQAGGFDIDTTENCISFFIDNGQRWTNAALSPTTMYAGYDNNTSKAINQVPFNQNGNGSVAGGLTDLQKNSSFPLTGEICSRLWAYDLKSGATYFVGGLPHEGSNIGVTSSKMFMNTEYNIKMSRTGSRTANCWYNSAPASSWENFVNGGTNNDMRSGPQNVGIIEYGWGWTPGDLSTFTSAATSYYRIVTEKGQLLGIESETTVNGGRSTMGASICAQQHDVNSGAGGLGASLTAIDDKHLIVSDVGGGLWLVDLDEYYTGPEVYSYSGDGSGVSICLNPGDNDCVENWTHPNNNYGSWYGINLSTHDFKFNYGTGGNRTLTDAWFALSHQTGHKVKTVIARRIANLNAQFNTATGNWQEGTWGSFSNTMGDVVFNPVDNSIPITNSPSIEESEQFSSGTYTQSIVVTWNQGRVNNNATSDGQYYTRKRISKFIFPLTAITQTDWAVQRGGGSSSTNYKTDELVGNTNGGGVDIPSTAVALVRNTYTNKLFTSARGKMYEVDTNTLVLSPGTAMNFRYFDGNGNPQNELINCYSASTNVTCKFPNAFSMRGGAQAQDCLTVSAYTYDCGRDGCISVLGQGGLYPTYSACTADCVSWSCQTICACPSGYTLSDGNCVDTEPAIINNGMMLVPGSQGSANGQNGTKFCTDYTCSSPHLITGPTVGVFDGMFGATGQYLVNGRLNSCGVWPFSSQPTIPTYQNKWLGVTKCIAASSDTRYLIGIGADNYFRISVNGNTIIDTLSGLNSPITGPVDDNFNYWHVIPMDVAAGNNSFTIEGYDTGVNASLAVDILGPFQTTEWTSINDFSQWSDIQLADIYNNNKIWSTCDLLNISSSVICDLTLPVVPAPNGPLDIMGFPDPWRETTYGVNNILDPTMVYSFGLPAGHVPGWGQVSTNMWGYSPAWVGHDYRLGSTPWFASGDLFTDPNTGAVTNSQDLDPHNMLFTTEQYGNNVTSILPNGFGAALNALGYPNNQKWAGMGSIGGQPFPWSNGSNPYGTVCLGDSLNPPVYGQVAPSTIICQHAILHSPFFLMGFGKQPCTSQCSPDVVLTGYYNNECVGCPAGEDAYGYSFNTWREVIDWLNSQGLTQSPIVDPNNPSVPTMVDYSADYWDVVHAIQAYWTPANPQPAGSCVHLVQTQTYTYGGLPGGGYQMPVHFYNYLPSACECSSTNGFFETQINECPEDYIWDGCNNECISITDCTTPDGTNIPANYTGGCVEILGTGQTDTYSSLTECELSCTTTSSGTTFWNCTNTGCITGTTGNYLDLTTCQASCYSFSCDTTGCETFNQYGGGGTGGTYTDSNLCSQNCISYNCGNFGCTQQSGSGGTFSTQAACTGTCLSYECLEFGCESYVGTGFTYQELSACTGVCISYVCQDSNVGSGCTLFNPPPTTPSSGVNYYGTGATSVNFMGSGFSSVTACQQDCVAWGCSELNLRTGTTVYGFLDTSSMDALQVQDAVISLSAFTNSLPGWNGNLYFTLIQDERWLSWPRIVYSGATAYGGGGLVGNANGCFDNLLGGYAMSWAIGQGIDANFYDNCNTAVNWAFPLLNFPTKGLPPLADGNDDILIVTFCDENGPDNPSDTGAYHCNSPVISNIPQYSSCTQLNNNMYYWQPTFAYKQDYTGYTTVWESVTASTTGVLNSYLYSSLPNQLLDAQKIFALHSLASISSGNKVAQDGSWNTFTAPRTTASGGILGGTPGLCDITDLTILEQQINPYVSTSDTFSPGGYGKLDKRGWGVDVGFLPLTQPQFTQDLSQFLTIGITSTTGCVSAQTLTNNVFPNPTLIECQTANTNCVRYNCTNIGCVQITGSTAYGMYASLEDCTGGTTTLPACTSYSCNTTGCTLYNVPNYGTGGTFTDTNDCRSGCTSFNCISSQLWYNMNPGWPFGNQSWDGCEQQLGSGGTFTNYGACTADCKSWECESPCSGGTGAVLTGCTEYPNSGATFIVESACTGTCLSLWYCIPESATNSCRPFMVQLPVTTPPNEYDTIAIWDVIADQSWNTMNFATFSFPVTYNVGGAMNWPGPCPYYHPDCCLDNNNNPLMYITQLSCTLFPTVNGFPQTFYSWSDLIGFSNGLGITYFGAPLDLTMSFTVVATAIQLHYNTPPLHPGTYLHYQSDFCECTEEPCSVVCDNGSGNIFNVYPNATGPHASSADAYSICCAVTYDCVEESDTNSCSGSTTISGIYSGVTSAMEWVSTNLPNTNLSTLIFESSAPPTLPTVCTGPNGGALHSFEPMSYSLLNNGNDYYTWNGFIQALSQSGLQGIASGMSFSYVDYQLNVSSASTISLCASNCSCIHTPCHCIEIDGSGGTYTQLTDCVSSCTCDGLSGTSFNCVNNTWNYEPICNDKLSIGTVLDEFMVVDWFRQFAPYDSFATRKTAITIPISGIIPGVTHLTWPEVQANMQTNNPWEVCYKEEYLSFTLMGVTFGPAIFYLPWTYVETISHPLVNGGALYSTYNTFLTSAINGGVTLNYNMTLSGACMAIDNFYGINYGCDINKKACCSEDDCYCYELFVTGGTYNSDTDCQSACCPTYSSYTCDAGSVLGCYPSTVAAPMSTLYTGPMALTNCMSCVINPACVCYSATSWNCITGTTIYSCEVSPGIRTPFLNQNSPGTLGASGVPLNNPLPNTNQFTFTYPLTASTIQPAVNAWYPSQAEAMMTTNYYWNNDKFFSATTWELFPGPFCPSPCIGPHNGVLYRLNSVSHLNINNFTPYYKWSDFLGAAQALGYSVTPATQINALEFAYFNNMSNNWEFDIEPCICSREELKDCYCEEVYGVTGQFSTSAICEAYCCEPIISYNCTTQGCIDPLDGSGMFYGVTALTDCETVCYEWECNGL